VTDVRIIHPDERGELQAAEVGAYFVEHRGAVEELKRLKQ
jgi:hypothetical protein